MALLTNLLGDEVKRGVKKAFSKSVKETTKDAISDAVSDSASKSLSKSLRNDIADEVTDAAIKKMPRNLTGAGVSSLEKNAGSTLDGILGRSSGITLKNAKKQSLEELTGYKSLGDALEGLDMTVDDLGKGEYKMLSRRNLKSLRDGAQEAANLAEEAFSAKAGGITNKTNLPKLNRQQYYEDTIGKLKNKGGVMSYKDVPEYMNSHLVTAGRGAELGGRRNDDILRELFNDDTSDISELYAKYEDLAQDERSNLYSPENVDTGLFLQGRKDAVEQDFADRLGGARDINIEGGAGRAQKVKVNRPETMAAEAVEEPAAQTINPELAQDIADIRAKVGATATPDAQGAGGSIGTAPVQVAGSEGFNVKLKDNKPKTITVGSGAVGSTKQQRAFAKLDDMTTKSLNANKKQTASLKGPSNSIGGFYKTVAERARREAIDQANIAAKSQTALALREDIKQQGLQYAERNGVTIDLSGIDNTVGLSATQKKKLAEFGLSLNDMMGGAKTVTPTKAEEIYKTLREYANKWAPSQDHITSLSGKEAKEGAKAVREAIDNAMDNINVDYKTSLLEQAAENGEDPAYLRAIAAKPDFKFSDLRKDQSDWMKINELSGNELKKEPTIKVLGFDTGMPNRLLAGEDKIKEKIYERQAYGAGGAGAGGAGGAGGTGGAGVPPTGAEGPINFETVGGQPSKLNSLLSSGKNIGLVGAGVLGGLMLSGNGGGQPTAGGQTLADVLQANQMQQANGQMGAMNGIGNSTDPYAGMTVGGYTYDELADGYARALQAGDASAANSIAKLMGIIEDKATATLNRQKYESSLKGGKNDNSASAVNVLANLYNLYNNVKSGTGPIAGNITNALNSITGGGYNAEANTYWSVSRGALGKMIKGMGDTGALSEGDQKRALQMIPNITDTREAAEQKFMALYNILSSAAQM